jgi:hypothetical protein
MTNPQYLGDGCYAHRDELDRLVLTTGHHDPESAYCTNAIVLEPEVIAALVKYINDNR